MKVISRFALTMAGLALLTLVTSAVPESATVQTTEDDALTAEYDQAVRDSAVYRPANLHPLFPLRFDKFTGMATVVTLTNYDYDQGPQTLSRDVWVTSVPEVQTKCRDFHENPQLRLRQLLGLQPTAQIIWFVTMTVGVRDVFRPATNPIVTTACLCGGEPIPFESGTRCEETKRRPIDYTCPENFPNWVKDDHQAWIARQMLSSYAVFPKRDQRYSYPWTRLGYTYDWAKDAGPQHYGASEYVVRAGSVIDVTDIKPINSYCAHE